MAWLILNPTCVNVHVTCNMASTRVTLNLLLVPLSVFAAAVTGVKQIADRKSSGLETVICHDIKDFFD